ncbi:MAG: type II secretion system protein GspJ [Planctomycetota bacterium]|nr:prepilin-type N-terminal cleavage/methylation domain-containing protein [Planctomycetaceae bacterium]MDQ3329038.1 type II secretion system protein GspJ [Planctomycetota bacterium]
MTNRLPQKGRGGFTLIEILLSLGLLMLVLAAAYSALNLFRIVTTAGREDAERSQLARAIERRLTADIRCVLFRQTEPEPTESTTPGGVIQQGTGNAAGDPETTTPPPDSSTTEAVPTITDPADAYATQSVGVFGDATTLVLHVSKPPRTSLLTPVAPTSLVTAATAPVTQSSDLRSISYFLAVAGAGGLQGAVGNTAAGGTVNFSMKQGLQGLARLDGDRLALQQADQTGSVDVLAQNAELIAPEVTELSFRYHDGTAWLDTWDSVSMNAVPRAIEVTLRIDVSLGDERPASRFAPAQALSSADQYRFVIAVPLADPTMGPQL